jgi:hypothetical protein
LVRLSRAVSKVNGKLQPKIASAGPGVGGRAMSLLHLNRINAHFSPVLDCGDKDTAGRHRKNKLTVGQMGILKDIAYAINNEDTFAISEEYLRKLSGATNQTLATAIRRFLSLGLITRERSSARKPYLYKVALKCPPDCEKLDKHNSKRELKALSESPSNQGIQTLEYANQRTESPSVQVTESPSNQGLSPLASRALIKNYKETNKELSGNSCFTCKGKSEAILGKRQFIHREGCRDLNRIVSGQGWEIIGGKLGALWNDLSLEDQQREYHKDISGMRERRGSEDRKQEIEEEKTLEKVRELVPDVVLTNWGKCIARKYDKQLGIHEPLKNLAISKSEQGMDLIPGRSWEKGAYPRPEDWGETDAALANA